MDSDIESLLKEMKEIDGHKLDSLVAEEIFGFQVRNRTVMFNEYTQVIGKDAEEPWCPICGNDEEFWREDELKRYSLHIEYAMEAAEKTGLFQKYVLLKMDGDKWSIGTYEHGQFVDLVTSHSPATAIVKAALIYNRMPKKEKRAGRSERKVRKRRIYRPKRILRTLRQKWAEYGYWEGETLDGRKVALHVSLPNIYLEMDGVRRKYCYEEEGVDTHSLLSMDDILYKVHLTMNSQTEYYRLCTCCEKAAVKVETLQELDEAKEIYCRRCADWVASLPGEVTSLQRTHRIGWKGTLAGDIRFFVAWKRSKQEYELIIDGRTVKWRRFGDQLNDWLKKLSKAEGFLQFANFRLAEGAALSFRCYLCKKEVPTTSIEDLDRSRHSHWCIEEETEEG